MGSATLFFALSPNTALLGDVNRDLVRTFKTVRDDPEGVYEILKRLRNSRASYYKIRSILPRQLSDTEASARFIFLNRHCFNGLYRTNQDGHFNVPYSPAKTGEIPAWPDFLSCSIALRTADIRHVDFHALVTENVRSGDFVYLDPPYAVTKRRIFREYDADSFAHADLDRLKDALLKIDRRGAKFLLTYAYCQDAIKHFSDWPTRRVIAQRNISGFAQHRRKAAELFVCNAYDKIGRSLI